MDVLDNSQYWKNLTISGDKNRSNGNAGENPYSAILYDAFLLDHQALGF